MPPFENNTPALTTSLTESPFAYASPNAPDVRNVVGTAVLAILAGFTRYCHIERLRRDAACAALLGLTKIVSDESLRRGLKKCDEATLDSWLARHERESCEPLLQYDYVMDVDNSVKCIFGHQEGAELGYNPQKPGRPSHNYHTAFIGTLRIVLTVDVKPEHQMEKILFASDELTGLIWAAALMRPSKSVMDLELKSVKKKYKAKNFAAGVDRSIIEKGCEMINMALDDVITECILGMREVAEEIGLKGEL